MLELYSLDVISHLPEFKGRKLKKYHLDHVDTVGAYGNEPFEIVFKNNTWQRVQVKLSIDGTDILTGKMADTSATGDMWVVEAYGTLSLKAWPETNKGGAQFIFTSADKSVAVNTHGDLSSRGVIAAAVFTEGYRHSYLGYDYFGTRGIRLGGTGDYYGNGLNHTFCDNVLSSNCSDVTPSVYFNDSKGLESLAAVGAGQHVEQSIQKTAGLTQPELNMIVKIKYMWWDDLIARAKANNVKPAPGTGFPGDEVRIMSIGSTPRIGSTWTPPLMPRAEFTRF